MKITSKIINGTDGTTTRYRRAGEESPARAAGNAGRTAPDRRKRLLVRAGNRSELAIVLGYVFLDLLGWRGRFEPADGASPGPLHRRFVTEVGEPCTDGVPCPIYISKLRSNCWGGG